MATGTTITNKAGQKAFFPTEIIPLLKQASSNYRADSAGMSDGGMCLTSSFVSYCELEQMEKAMTATGQTYKNTASGYAANYNRLFEIDC